ncbi:hypothetical protein V8C43DRAFT_274777, partial [Trichoderma afarasin]
MLSHCIDWSLDFFLFLLAFGCCRLVEGLLGVGATCGEDGRLLAPKGEKRSSIEGFLGRGEEWNGRLLCATSALAEWKRLLVAV